jgi:hypothetical protein
MNHTSSSRPTAIGSGGLASEFLMSSFPFRFFACAALCALLTSPAAAHHHHKAAVAARPGFDGTYRVEITTTGGHGTCPASYAGTLTIHDFRVVALSDPSATATGGIESDGTVSLAFRREDQFANVGGRMASGGGKGFWSSPTAYCGGLWHAEREN